MYHTSCDFLADFLRCFGPTPEDSQTPCGDTLNDKLGTEAPWEEVSILLCTPRPESHSTAMCFTQIGPFQPGSILAKFNARPLVFPFDLHAVRRHTGDHIRQDQNPLNGIHQQ